MFLECIFVFSIPLQRGSKSGKIRLEIKQKKLPKRLNIPLEIVDARKEFKKKIIDYFVSSYKKGITPNPCVVCNKEMKFRLLFDLLKKYKADYVATGHYARIARQSSAGNYQSPSFSHFSSTAL